MAVNAFEINTIYFTFRCILTFVAWANGYVLSRKKRSIRVCDFWPTIFAYTFYSGLRWGRGTDYNGYYYVYKEIINGVGRDDNEPLFAIIIKFCNFIAGDYQWFIIFTSFVLVLASCIYLKDFKPYLSYAMPMVLLSLTFAENLIRWYLGFSFVLIGMSYLNKKERNWKSYACFSFAGLMVHYGLILNILLFTIVAINKKIISYKYSISIFVVCFFAFNPDIFSGLVDVVKNINLGTRFMGYQQDAEKWLVQDDNTIHGSVGIMTIFTCVYFLYVAYLFIRKNPRYNYTYTLAVVSVIFHPISQQLELLMRIGSIITYFKIIFLGVIWCDVFKKAKNYGLVIYCITIVYIIYTAYSLLVVSSFSPNDEILPYYIWDSNGRKTLF